MKKLCLIFFCIISALSFSGCSGIFTKEYVEIKDYIIPSAPNANMSDTVSVTNYNGLKRALTDFVVSGADKGKLVFDMSYECDPVQELNSACWELRTKNPLFQYCVNGMNYDVSKIVAYYEAVVYINYSISPEDMDKIIRIAYFSETDDYIKDALYSQMEKLTLNVTNSTYTEDQVVSHIKSIVSENPLLCIFEPDVKVNLYSGSALQKLYEINLKYQKNPEITQQYREEIESLDLPNVLKIKDEDEARDVLEKALKFLRTGATVSEDLDKNSIYSALIGKKANSEGYAVAYKYLCSLLDLECYIVYGQKGRDDYCWNIVGFDDIYFHVDVARCIEEKSLDAFLLSDKDIWGEYMWNTYLYKACQFDISEIESEEIEEAVPELPEAELPFPDDEKAII